MTDIDWSKLPLGIVGFAAGGALLYASSLVPGKLKIIPVAGGLGAIAFGGYEMYLALAGYVPGAPSVPDDAPNIKTTILIPDEGAIVGWPWWVELKYNIVNDTGLRKRVTADIWQDMTVISIREHDIDPGVNTFFPFPWPKWGIFDYKGVHSIMVVLRDTQTHGILNGSGAVVSVNIV